MTGFIIFALLTALAAGVIFALHLGGKAFDQDDPKPPTCTDDTIQIPRVRAKIRPDAY